MKALEFQNETTIKYDGPFQVFPRIDQRCRDIFSIYLLNTAMLRSLAEPKGNSQYRNLFNQLSIYDFSYQSVKEVFLDCIKNIHIFILTI